MFDFKTNIVLGHVLSQIRSDLKQITELHLGLFISNLRYKTEQEGAQKKKDYYLKLSFDLKKVNQDIRGFNQTISRLDRSLAVLKVIDVSRIKRIIYAHKGDYPQGELINEIMGDGDSPSVLARKHTALLLRNALAETLASISEFLKNLDFFLSPFNAIDSNKIRKVTNSEIKKIRAIYSIGCQGEAVFMVGRLLENIIIEYLLLLKRNKKISLSTAYIQSADFKFENKIDFLKSKKINVISNSQFAKMKSVKWDRNLYGHYNKLRPKDANAMIIIGLQNVAFLDKKISQLKKNQSAK